MKIAIVSTPIFQVPLVGYGGLEDVAYQSAKGLAAKGHEVALIAPEGSSCPNATIIPIGKPGTIDERMAFKMYADELPKYDVVIDHTWMKWAYMMKAEGRLQIPVMGVLHAPVNTMYQTMPPVEKPSIVCISYDQGMHFEALHSRSYRVCRNGIDLDLYKPIGSLKRTDRYLFLARFSTIKGPDLAIEACSQTRRGLDLIGDLSITNEPEYFNQCQARCDGKQIKMVGPCKRSEAVWWYSQANALLHPNMRFREPLGLAPLEAQACGCPVLAWEYGAMRETVKHGETGFLCKSLDGMIAYMKEYDNKSEHARGIMRDTCLDWVRDFSIDKMVDGYEELCQEAIDSGGW